MLIALGGLPGVGKSTLARSLSRRIRAVYLRIDTIEQAMGNSGLNVSGPEGYLAVRDLAQDNLRIGHTVIVDSVNPIAITRDYWRELAARLTVQLVEIEVVCSDERKHCQRIESRTTDIPGLVLPTWQQVLDRHYKPWTTAHVVDTAGRTLEDGGHPVASRGDHTPAPVVAPIPPLPKNPSICTLLTMNLNPITPLPIGRLDPWAVGLIRPCDEHIYIGGEKSPHEIRNSKRIHVAVCPH